MSSLSQYINIDPKIQNGTPVFAGTRVPVKTMFWHLQKGTSVNQFLEEFPNVSREKALAVLEFSYLLFGVPEFNKIESLVDGSVEAM